MISVDLNSDPGEGLDRYSCGDDDTLLNAVTSANVECDVHGGGPIIMVDVFTKADDRDVAIGAHPGFPDLWGFGQRRPPSSQAEIERFVANQIGAATTLVAYAGHRVPYVKTHEVLGNIADEERPVANVVARTFKAADPALALLAIALPAPTSRLSSYSG